MFAATPRPQKKEKPMHQVILTIHKKAEILNPPAAVKNEIIKAMTMPNPAYTQAEKFGRYTGHLEPELTFYENRADRISFLRGYTGRTIGLLKRHGVKFRLQDQRRTLKPLNLTFQGTLRDYQTEAVKAALERDHGVLQLPTGAGKTVIALALMAERKQPTLILCHTRELSDQWQARIKQFLGIDAGIIGGGKFEPGPITVGLFQTVKNHLEDLPPNFGNLIVDEVHRCPADTFRRCVTAFDAIYLTGLSATSYRNDGLTRLIYSVMGDRVFNIDQADLETTGAILKPRVIIKKTEYEYFYEDNYQDMITDLIEDPYRNYQIICDVKKATGRPGTILIVSDRVRQLRLLSDLLGDEKKALLTGQTPKAKRQKIVEDVNSGRVKVLFSTIQLIGEGFDCSGLSTLFLAAPVKFKGRIIQAVGRILRPADGKQALIYDYQDAAQPVLAAQARTRNRTLAELAGGAMAAG
jgi:superfamily II DNA or RNA helicase